MAKTKLAPVTTVEQMIAKITMILSLEDHSKSIEFSIENLNPDLFSRSTWVAGTFTRLLYRKLQLYKSFGKSTIPLNRKLNFQFIIQTTATSEGIKVFDLSEKLTINTGRLFKEFEIRFAHLLNIALNDAMQPIALCEVEDLPSESNLPVMADLCAN
jgi:hypothetical protein